eukprot:3088553-Amphidinium_carterae.3
MISSASGSPGSGSWFGGSSLPSALSSERAEQMGQLQQALPGRQQRSAAVRLAMRVSSTSGVGAGCPGPVSRAGSPGPLKGPDLGTKVCSLVAGGKSIAVPAQVFPSASLVRPASPAPQPDAS